MQFDKLPAAQVSSTEPIWLEKLPFLVNENYTCKRLSVQKWGDLIFYLEVTAGCGVSKQCIP